MNNNTQLEEKILQVPIEDIIPNRFQPRLAFDDASLNDLALSIKQHGIIQPLVLRRKNDKYEIIAGERRYKAAKMAGLVSVPAIISNLSDKDSAQVAIVENVQRKNLSAIEEAKSYQALLDKGYMTQEDLAKKMGLSQSNISNKLRLLTLDESVQQAVIQEKISERHARSLLKVKDKEMQKVLLTKIINERLTVKQLEDEIKKIMPASEEDTTTGNGVSNINEFIANVTNKLNTQINQQELEDLANEEKGLKEPQEDFSDLPIIESIPNISNIINNSVDINPMNEQKGLKEPKEEILNLNENMNTNITPEKMTNKFFNFLESEAANMNFDEVVKPLEPKKEEKENIQKPTDLLSKIDNIEMLDDFIIPTSTNNEKIMNNDYLDEVIKTIRNLNLDKDKVVVEEINLPTEYHINIKIKKDKI